MFAIAGRELRSLFLSPLAWVLIGVMQFILAWLFLIQLEEFLKVQPQLATLESAPGVTDLVTAPLLQSAAVILMLLTPLLSMRLMSEEYRSGTIDLLLSAPISMLRILLGKYLALLAIYAAILTLIAMMPLSLLLGGALDMGRLAAGLLGLSLLLAAFAAIGLLLSSYTDQPAVAAVGSYGLLLFLWVINLAGGGEGSELFAWLSLSSHYQRMLSGLIHASDIIYYLLLITSCLSLANHRLESRRTLG
ncbi:MAG: ABC transporter permease [Sedimenticola sp.]